jgi:flagellin-like hook-associated protein FlgL
MEKVFVATRVVKKLVETEAAVDQAFAESAELLSVMLKARKDVNADLKFADDVQVKLMEAMAALSEARTAMVGVHAGLEDAKLRLGIRTRLTYEVKSRLSDDDQVEMRDVG